MNNFKRLFYPWYYNILSVLILCFFLTSVSALNPQKSGLFSFKNNWVYHSEIKGVKIYYQISSCEGKSVVYLKFNNTNHQNVKISWKEVFSTKQVPQEKEGYLGQKHLVLIPGQTSQTNCSQITIKECITLPDQVEPTYIADILKFDLKDIIVTDLI